MQEDQQKKIVDVLCVGQATYDLFFSVDRHPDPDEKSVASALVGCGGGPAANAAVTVARLGLTATFAGYLGLDLFGNRHLQELKEEGVRTDLIIRDHRPTPISVVLVKPDGSRALVNYRGETGYLPAGSLDFSGINPKVILFDGHQPLLSKPLAELARKRKIPTVLDAGSLHRGTVELAGMVDYLVSSEAFARDFTGTRDAASSATMLHDLAPHVVITLGDRGLVWKSSEGAGRLPSFPVRAVDTTGAGDSFHGAFAARLAQKENWAEILRYASAVAALCCTKMGARPGIPFKKEVELFLQADKSGTAMLK